MSEEDLKKLPFIKWCTLEAIRLRSPGAITKKVVNPIKIQVSFVGFCFSPKGCCMICLERGLPKDLDKIQIAEIFHSLTYISCFGLTDLFIIINLIVINLRVVLLLLLTVLPSILNLL